MVVAVDGAENHDCAPIACLSQPFFLSFLSLATLDLFSHALKEQFLAEERKRRNDFELDSCVVYVSEKRSKVINLYSSIV